MLFIQLITYHICLVSRQCIGRLHQRQHLHQILLENDIQRLYLVIPKFNIMTNKELKYLDLKVYIYTHICVIKMWYVYIISLFA